MKILRRLGFLLLQMSVFLAATTVNAEDIQVSSYNTSPYGSYKKLVTTGDTYLGTADSFMLGHVVIGGASVTSADLELVGSMRIDDPTATDPAPRALTCIDATGLATWKKVPWTGNLNGGAGVNGRFAYWTSASPPTLASANIDEDLVRGRIGIGTLNPLSLLSVSGRGSTNGAVYADNTLTSIQYGIFARSTGDASYGAYGVASGGTEGYGVYGKGATTGIKGVATDPTNGKGVAGKGITGVYGVATDSTGAGGGAGVYGISSSSTGHGVHGKSAGTGLYCEGQWCGGNRSWTDTSDFRLKTAITTIEQPIQKLEALRGVAFEWKNEPGKPELGLIAQEVSKVFPEVVQKNPAGYYAMNMTGLNGLLAEVIKEQQKSIDSLKKDIADLRAREEKGVGR